MTSESAPGHEVKIGSTTGFQINIVNSDVQDTVGAVLLALLALLALFLAFALMRAQRQNRKLLEQLLSKTG